MAPLLITFLVVLLSGLIYFIFDYLGAASISIHPGKKFGLDCLISKDLIVQEFDNDGNLWATRGLIIYCLKRGDARFKKAFHLSVGFSIFWLNNFTFIRKYLLRPECIEMTISDKGHFCAFTSGSIFNKLSDENKFRKTFNLPNFGVGIGRGIMSTGLSKLNDEDFVLGEYFNNPERTAVKIYRYKNATKDWYPVYEFPPGKIRHVHSLQKDPYTGKSWICTGDELQEPMIGWSDDNFKSINVIGQGSQKWRCCQLVFTEDAVYWGADTGIVEFGGIYRWDKKTAEVKQLHKIAGAVFFATRLANGSIVMSTDREGFPNEKDEKTRLLILDNEDKLMPIECGSWKYRKKGIRFNFAKLRLQRNQGSHLLAVSCLNQKEISDGDLLIFSEKVFQQIRRSH